MTSAAVSKRFNNAFPNFSFISLIPLQRVKRYYKIHDSQILKQNEVTNFFKLLFWQRAQAEFFS